MALPNKNQLKLLIVFYKSTLTLSIASSFMLGAFFFLNPLYAMTVFGFCFLSGGTAITLTYTEISKQHEYYFYYNKGLSKRMLLWSCGLGNLLVGLTFISIPLLYAQFA